MVFSGASGLARAAVPVDPVAAMRRTAPETPPVVPSAEALAAGRRALISRLAPGADVWVFGYGSLMWDPGFAHEAARPALLYGYHRALCIYSHRHRGTVQRPGLVLGLDRGGSCRGMAYRIAGAQAAATLGYLWDREMITGVYVPRRVRVRLARDQVVCWAFVANRRHAQYAGGMAPAAQAAFVLQGRGESGRCRDYLANTVRHLDALGIADGPLHRLMALVEAA